MDTGSSSFHSSKKGSVRLSIPSRSVDVVSPPPAPGRPLSKAYLLCSPSKSFIEPPREHLKLQRKEKPPTYARLYAQGVHLLDHKDQIHKMFGYTKTKEVPRTPTKQAKSSKRNLLLNTGKEPSVHSKIRDIRRSLSSSDESVLVQVSRKCAEPLNKPGEKRPGVAPLKKHATKRELSPGKENNESNPIVITAPNQHFVENIESNTLDIDNTDQGKVKQLMEQIDLLKSTLGLSDEDLQWKLESSKTNGFLVSDRHLNEAEEEYDRLLYEQSLLLSTPADEFAKDLDTMLQSLVQYTKDIAHFKAKLSKSQAELGDLKAKVEDPKHVAEVKAPRSPSPTRRESLVLLQVQSMDSLRKEVLSTQEQFKQAVLKQNQIQIQLAQTAETMVQNLEKQIAPFITDENKAYSTELLKLTQEISQATGEPLLNMSERAALLCRHFKGYRTKELAIKERKVNSTLKKMEIWRTRRENAKEYPAELRKVEAEWRAKHLLDNQICLERLCSLIPESIAAMSIEMLLDATKAMGVLYTRDLANYLKQNKLLQWVVTHEKDKARENFITGDTAQCFTNIEMYDITELRAIYLALPENFEFDKEGRKSEWRQNFVSHLKVLVQQQNGDSVTANLVKTRAEVKLKPLNDKQLLNPVYRYPTEDEIKQRLLKFETQAKRLAQKKSRLQALNDNEIPLAKKEYHAVSDDCRSENLIKSFGKATLIRLRDEAKKIFQSLCQERDSLKGEVAAAERTIQQACPTHEQYLEEIAAIRQLPPEVRGAVIPGPFPPRPILKPKERAMHKKLSAEEEALARKHELSSAIAKRTKEFQKPDTTEASSVQTPEKSPVRQTPNVVKAVKTVINQMRAVKSVHATDEVLNFLQNEFCQRRSSIDAVAEDKPSDSAPKQPKSHALLKMMGLATTPSLLKKRPSIIDPTLLDDIAKPNNLAEIQKRRSSRSPCPSPAPVKPIKTQSSLSSPKEDGPPNFLQELQARAQKPKQMSFLDELKRKTESITECSNSANPSKPVNFLDELKRKSQDKKATSNEDKRPNFLDEIRAHAKTASS
ncbi:hypothetical protein THRCLA_06176 [Thraustotheca clavata]|uniref:Uncharacterized protein n=1 Tax=Thraustotheca clavata TaxID=74557 RepID=A0A1V9ZQ70_9STRA|nr:hypothetical protein THRCLA_06176 [Thraustotheca clavata]